ncbi:hypothetical protein ACFPN0_01350 [Kitasatospora cinereorecta]
MPSATGSTPGRLPFVVWVLAVGTFLMGTTEFVIAGLHSPLGLTGPALVGAVFAALTLLPLTALALRGTTDPSRIIAHHTTDADEPQAADATVTAARSTPVRPRWE